MTGKQMRAVAIDKFGGLETLKVRNIPRPSPGENQILIHVDSAGVGVWDPMEREGVISQVLGQKPDFPFVLGTEGAGKVAEVGERVRRFKVGDSVYGITWGTSPKAGFYAEYVAMSEEWASKVPSRLPIEQAGALAIDSVVALRGLEEIIGLKPGEKLMVFGASGGIGHLAVQLGVRMGAHVFAIASGEDGVALAMRLGAEDAVDGHKADVVASAREFAPGGFDAALLTTHGEVVDRALTAMASGGRVAHPFVMPQQLPTVRTGIQVKAITDREFWQKMPQHLIGELNELIQEAPFEVHLGGTFRLDQAVDAHRALGSHHLGKIVLLPGNS